MASDLDLSKLEAAAIASRDGVIRSDGWAGTVEMAELLRKDEAYMLAAAPEAVLALIARIRELESRATEAQKLFGMDVFQDAGVKPGTAELRVGGKVVGAITGMSATEAEATGKQGVGDAKRYAKLRNWMSSNVPEGWQEVERLAAVACYVSWEAFDDYLDNLPECNVGMCERTAPSATVDVARDVRRRIYVGFDRKNFEQRLFNTIEVAKIYCDGPFDMYVLEVAAIAASQSDGAKKP